MKDRKCINCDYREINCHTKCESYKKYKEKLKKIKESREKGNVFYAYLVDKRWRNH